MRAHKFSYYGRPSGQPYILSEVLRRIKHPHCNSRSDWDTSRIRALYARNPERAVALEQVQRDTTGPHGWDRLVLTHMDFSERNILVDPNSLEVTGFLDWEMACIMPAYYEYVTARLSGGHQPEWRKDLLDVLRSVLHHECDSVSAHANERDERYKKTLAAWDAMVNVERIARGFDDDCYWTLETDLPDISQRIGPAL
ncbi:hypothetical protein PRK78_002109 [Emydomyces testavorans]|uniref:Aminoglycoside phosphotransferase domain-containing protein n=1 Tax=Emydomyces testavorans TaxID=2070801 RepID=A0AAF0DFG6_9EURO|nr:hypothetical protein PRK78_002109 [Emydomyces testavorans]